MNQYLFKRMDVYINSLNNIEEDEKECKHNIIIVDGFNTCNICGSVMSQIFKTESNDHKFFEDKQRIKSKHDQIKDIKKHLQDYIINGNSKKISPNKIFELEYYLFKNSDSYFIRDFKTKYITRWMKQEKIDKLHFAEIYCHVILKGKSNSQKLNIQKINEILDICKKFILFYKDKIKNISKRILVYYIVKHKYNIQLDDYIGGTTKNTFIKYKNFTEDFFNKTTI